MMRSYARARRKILGSTGVIGPTVFLVWLFVMPGCSGVALAPNKSMVPDTSSAEIAVAAPAASNTLETLDAAALQMDAAYAVAVDASKTEVPDQATRKTALTVMSDLFGDSKVCTLPRKLKDRFSRSKAEAPEDTLPRDVLNGILDVKNDEGPFFSGVSFSHVIHLFNFSTEKPREDFVFNVGTSPKLDGAPTVSQLDVRKIRVPDSNSLFYELDCSGYLTASMQVTAGAGIANVKTEALAKMDTNASMAAIRVVAASPVGLALSESSYPEELRFAPLTRFGVLFSVAERATDRADTDYIVVPKYVHVVATTTQKSRNLQGRFDVSASGGGGVGIVSGRASASSGFAISNDVSYSTFEVVYLPLPKGVLQGSVSQKISALRTTVQELTLQATIGVHLDTAGEARVFRPVLPANVCLLDWRAGTSAVVRSDFGRVVRAMTDPDRDGEAVCTFTLSLSTAGVAALKEGKLHVHYPEMALKMQVPTP